jgi:IclR family transcriptional regulator, pca regulon regulatory protein
MDVQATADRDFITALARGLEVLHACGRGERGKTLSEIAEVVGLSRATARRSLLTLGALGYVAHDGRLFYLTPKVLSLGTAYIASNPLARIVQPFLERIRQTLDESCSVTVLDHHDIVYVARAQARRIVSDELAVGSRLPAFATAMGRVLLAARPAHEVSAMLQRTPLQRYTDHTVTGPALLMQIIARTAEEGYCIADQELELGLRSIAVPVRANSGAVVGALNVGVHAARCGRQEMEERFLPVLRDAAAEMRPLLLG